MKVECKGRRVKFIAETKLLPNGNTVLVDRVVFPESAAVLPVFSDGRVVLLKQYRPSIEKWILEAPAGVVDRGETPEETARRELEEEAGLLAGELVELGSGYVSPGYSTEFMHLFLAINPSKGQQRLEKHEIIEVKEYSLREAFGLIDTGEIADVKTITLILGALHMLSI
ncbi:MAG: NUDIX hydrolase [Desulfurococcales archaeon]|nr:NUDIX hydrolase [Desulfurococcales archaeon]